MGDDVSRCRPAQVAVTIVTPAADVPGAFDLDPDPICRDDVVTTTQGQAVVISVLDNDEDVDLQGAPFPLAVVFAGLADAPEASEQGGTVTVSEDERTVTYLPPAGFTGSDAFAYTAQGSLGEGCSADVTVTVSGSGDDGDGEDRRTDPEPEGTPSGAAEADRAGALARTGTDHVVPSLVLGAASLLLGAALLAGSRRPAPGRRGGS